MRRHALVLILFAAGCSFFSKSKNAIFTLDRIAGTTPAVANVRSLPVGIDSLLIPPGFDRKEIVVRQANQQLDVRSSQLWSAAFQDLVLHTLATDLASRMPEGAVVLPGETKPLGAMRSVDVAFEDLAAGPNRNVTLDCHWVLRQAGAADISHHEQISIDIAGLDSREVAAGISRALAALADRMASQL